MTPSTTSPAPSSSTSSQARWTAGRVFMGSRPFLELGAGLGAHASFCRGAHGGPVDMALSNTMVVVSSTMPLYSPPITPAIATGLPASAITS